MPKQRILGLHHCNLGDHIRSMGIAAFKGELDGVRHKLSTMVNGTNYGARLQEIHNLMDGYFIPDLAQEQANTPPPSWHNWAAPPMRAAERWNAAGQESGKLFATSLTVFPTRKLPP